MDIPCKFNAGTGAVVVVIVGVSDVAGVAVLAAALKVSSTICCCCCCGDSCCVNKSRSSWVYVVGARRFTMGENNGVATCETMGFNNGVATCVVNVSTRPNKLRGLVVVGEDEGEGEVLSRFISVASSPVTSRVFDVVST